MTGTRTGHAPGAVRALGIGLLLLAPPAGAAQQGGSILNLLDPQGRELATGAEVMGELTERDYLAAGRRVQAWAVEGREGEALQIDMVSDVLDPYLYLAGPGLEELSDDDGGEGTNARLCVEFPASGTYRVVASSFGSGTGPYQLRAVDRASCAGGYGGSEVTDFSELETGDRTLPWGGEVSGALTSADPTLFSSPVQAWAVEGRAGETLTIDLFSPEFDAYLTVLGPGLDDWLTNDDGAGGCNSRIAVAFPETGTYRAVVSSVAGRLGAFRLTTYEDPPAPRPGGCIPPSASAGPEPSVAVEDLPNLGAVEVGASVTGTLSSEGRFNGRPAERWTLEAREGQQLAIQQTSDLIDSYLYLRGPGFDTPVNNDDVDGTLNSRICVTLPESGTYDVISAGFGSDDVGPYRLSVTADPEGEICDDFLVSLRSGFARIPMEGTALAPGVAIEGALDPATDERHPVDGSLIDVYGLDVAEGESVVVDLISDQFDAYMYLVGPGLGDSLIDDDGGGRCNSRIELFAPASGTFRVVVNSLSDTGAGAYTLRVSSDAGPVAEGECTGASLFTNPVSTTPAGSLDNVEPMAGRALPLGAEVSGELTASDPVIEEGKHAQAWTLEVRSGRQVAVELLSDDFDSYMYVTGPGLGGVLADDDGATGTNSRIAFTPEADTTVRVIVSTYGAGSVGRFRLRALRLVDGTE